MAIKTIKMPDGKLVEIDEWLHWPQFSTVEFTAASSVNLRLFTYVVGQRVPAQGVAARNATESDTNQVARARMNHDESFIAFNMTYEPFALTSDTSAGSPALTLAVAPAILATNLRRLQRDLMVDLFVGAGITKPMARAPLSYYGQGVGSPAWGTGDAVAVGVHISYGTGGRISPLNQRRWNLPVFIESDRVMFVHLHSPPGAVVGLGQNIRLRWYIDGLKRRPVA